MKILVADDSKVMRQLVGRALRQAGYDGNEVVEASDGREALEKIVSERPDLVLSDWNMPEMTGIEVLRKVRGQGLEVPFGFVTSESTEAMKEAAKRAGAQFLIVKPFTADQVREALEPILGGS